MKPQPPIPTAPPSVLLHPGAEVAELRPRRPAGEGGGARVPLLTPQEARKSLVRRASQRVEHGKSRASREAGSAPRFLGEGGACAEARAIGVGLFPGVGVGEGGPPREGEWPAPRSLSTPPENFPLRLRAPRPAKRGHSLHCADVLCADRFCSPSAHVTGLTRFRLPLVCVAGGMQGTGCRSGEPATQKT
ncbi:hypothetical protein NN561_002140 [Cricetulus griseus]